MRKFIKWIDKNKYKIFTVFVFLFVVISISNDIAFAKINKYSDELQGSVLDSIEAVVDKILHLITNFASGIVTRVLAAFLMAIAVILFLIMYIIWGMLGGSFFNLPFPDSIVFNKIVLFDPNFINPTPNSALADTAKGLDMMRILGDACASIYFTFFLIAGLIMVIAAMVIGIKLAISSIAIEKAQYKETLNKWIIGIVLLFCLHFLILGVFTLNEQICEIASKICDDTKFVYDFSKLNPVTKVVNGIGTFFNNLFNGDKPDTDSVLKVTFKGYGGILFYLLFNVLINQDLVCTLALLALLGQIINLIVQYIKRLIFVIFLALVAPLVVAVDVIKRAI